MTDLKDSGISASQIKALRDTPPQTKDELRDWIKVFLGVYFYDTAIDEGNSSPMDFIWDGYSRLVLNKVNGNKYKILGMAARGSQKTLACAVLEFLCLLHDKNRNIVHMASIAPQSKVCYGYLQDYAMRPLFQDGIESSVMTETKSKSGRTLSVTHGTVNATNAYHGGSLVLDEVDLLPKKIFNEAHGMLTSTISHRGLIVYISSRKYAFGNIENLLKLSADISSGITVHRWGLLEQCEQCPTSRSGTKKVNYYVDSEKLIALTEEEYNREYEKEPYVKCEGFEGCGKCGIFSFCKGNLKKPKKFNPYYTPIDTALSYFKGEDIDFFKAQRLNLKPSKVGLVFPNWDELRHLKTYGQMWEIFNGEPHPDIRDKKVNDIGIDEMISCFLKAGCRFCLGVDFGFTDPFVALLIVLDGSDRVYILDHIETTGRSDAECALMTSERWPNLPLTIYPDTESPSGIKEFRKIIESKRLNWNVSGNTVKDIDMGIGIVRNFLRIPGTVQARMYVHHSVGIIKTEMRTHHYMIRKSDGEVLDKPEDGNDHAISGLRYVLATIYSRSAANLSSPAIDSAQNLTQAPSQKPISGPSISEVAEKLGHSIGELTEEDLKALIDGEEGEKKLTQGGSGFSWSF